MNDSDSEKPPSQERNQSQSRPEANSWINFLIWTGPGIISSGAYVNSVAAIDPILGNGEFWLLVAGVITAFAICYPHLQVRASESPYTNFGYWVGAFSVGQIVLTPVICLTALFGYLILSNLVHYR